MVLYKKMSPSPMFGGGIFLCKKMIEKIKIMT